MISLILILIAVPIIVIISIVGAVSGKGKSRPPAPKDPIDKYMDDNYADIDWLRNGKL